MQAPKRDRLLKITEAADILGLEPKTIYEWVSAKRIQIVRLSARAIRIRESEINRIIDERTVEAAGE